MKILFYLLKNSIASALNDRRAQVCNYEIITEKELFEYITRSGSSVTMGELKAIYEEIISAIYYFLKQGYGINTEFIRIKPVIVGVFDGDDDNFDPARHKIKFKVTLGKRYSHTADDVKTEKIIAPNNGPLPRTFEDLNSESVNETVTPGGTATLCGARLKFHQDNPQEGIFMIDSTNTEHHITKIIGISNATAVFQIPDDLAAGEYSLEVRTRYKNSKKLKTGKLPATLTV
jgi:hypothetical protein